jgi:16S rRNA (guanine966-N2)-methyltransferase
VSRIIAGLAGSIKLKSAAKATRPTSDRVKESVFAKLESRETIEGARVLDLFAGTGALGLEAASRGATWVTLVEKDHAAAAVCAENLKSVQSSLKKQGHTCGIKLEKQEVKSFLARNKSGFDLVFIDPPYEMANKTVEVLLEELAGSLHPEALIVVERDSRSPELKLPAGLTLETRKNYGDTSVYFLEV